MISSKLFLKSGIRQLELILQRLVPSGLARLILQKRGVVIAITSNRNFYQATLSKCVGSLVSSGFPASRVYFFIGGYESDYERIDVGYGINAFKCPHNSIDFTSLVSIIEMNLNEKCWFIIHDTVAVSYTHLTLPTILLV